MTVQEKRKEVEAIKKSAGEAKRRLIRLEGELRSIGANREANSLRTIIGRLEDWQNR